MPQLSIPTSRLDRIAMGLSGLCLVHCIGTAILLGLLASAGGFLGSPVIHEVGLTLAMVIGLNGLLAVPLGASGASIALSLSYLALFLMVGGLALRQRRRIT